MVVATICNNQSISRVLLSMLRQVALGWCLLTVPAAVFAQVPLTAQIKTLHIPLISKRPLLEEFLNGNSRADMLRIDDFRQRQPGDGWPDARPHG